LRVSLPDKCLLYLLDRVDISDEDPTAEQLTQDKMAENLRVSRAEISRAMARLIRSKLAKTAKVHARGRSKRLLAYFLTDEGARRATQARNRLEDLEIALVDEGGKEEKCRLYEAMAKLPKRMKFSEVAAHVEGGRLDLRRLMEWRERVYGGKAFDVRDAIAVPNFRGRAEILARLDEFLEDPITGCFLLIGLPGIGKTALASKWVGDLKGQVHVLWRRVSADTTAKDLLREIGGLLRSIGKPALADYVQRPAEANVDQSVNILRRDLSDVRALIVIDNAHLAQHAVSSLISEILRFDAKRGRPKVLLISRQRVRFWRPEEAAHHGVREEELRNLPHHEAVDLMAALGVAEERRAVVWKSCGGHPLALELAVDESVSLDKARRISASWLTQEVLSNLDAAALEAIAFAAVFEGPVPPSLLGSYLQELSRLCLVRESGENMVDLHDLVREAAIQSLPPQKIIDLHVRAGHYLTGSKSPRDVVEAIRHFIAGEAFEEAASLASEKGAELIEAGFSDSLLALLDRLAPSAKRLPETPRIRLLRGQALFTLGRLTEAAKAFEECTRSEDRRLAGEAYLGLGQTEVQRYSSLAESYLMKARDLFESLGALRLFAQTQYWIGGVYEDAGQAEKAREAFEKGRAIALDVGDRRWEGLCAYGIARTIDSHTRIPEAIEVYKDALELLEREGSRLDVAKVCTAIGGSYNVIDRFDEAEVYLNRGLKEARATGAVGVLSGCLYNLGIMHITPDSVREAIPFFKEAVELDEQQERYNMAACCYAWMAVDEWKDGSAKLGDQYMARADKLVSRTREPNLRSEAFRVLARAHMRVERRDEARRYYESAIEEARAAGLVSFGEFVKSEMREMLG